MDIEDKENPIVVNNGDIMCNNNNTSIEQMDSIEMQLANENENVLKPYEHIETLIENSVPQKETVEILSVELVTLGTELENTEKELKNLIDHEATSNHSIQTTIMEDSGATAVIEEVHQSHEGTKLTGDENIECVTEPSDDDNMESELCLETTTNAENFFTNSTTILTDIENIQTSSAMQDKTPSKLESKITNFTSPPIAVTSALSLLAQYDSDDGETSETDSVIEVPSTTTQDYRNQVVEINSDSDSEESDSSSGVEYLNEIRRNIEKRTEVLDDEEDEEEEDEDEGDDNEDNIGKKRHKPKLRVKGEMLLDDLPPIQDLQITVPAEECIEFGKIHSIVDQLLLVAALPNAILLDLETVLFLEKGQKVLGKVFDVLGQVADPLYCVRFNSNKEIKEKEIDIGDIVYVAPKTQYTQYVILSSLMKLKGSDASWENDNEPPPRFLDYSDDEQEQMAKRQLRNKDRPIEIDDPSKRPRTTGGDRSYTPHNRNRFSRFNNPSTHQRQQQQPNYNRNSWHSNYYPQQYQGPPPSNYGYGSQPRPQHYTNQGPMYSMPPMHTMSFPPPPYGSPQSGVSHMPPHQLMPNSFSIRPPALHGAPHQQQFISPPPPPGSQ